MKDKVLSWRRKGSLQYTGYAKDKVCLDCVGKRGQKCCEVASQYLLTLFAPYLHPPMTLPPPSQERQDNLQQLLHENSNLRSNLNEVLERAQTEHMVKDSARVEGEGARAAGARGLEGGGEGVGGGRATASGEGRGEEVRGEGSQDGVGDHLRASGCAGKDGSTCKHGRGVAFEKEGPGDAILLRSRLAESEAKLLEADRKLKEVKGKLQEVEEKLQLTETERRKFAARVQVKTGGDAHRGVDTGNPASGTMTWGWGYHMTLMICSP